MIDYLNSKNPEENVANFFESSSLIKSLVFTSYQIPRLLHLALEAVFLFELLKNEIESCSVINS